MAGLGVRDSVSTNLEYVDQVRGQVRDFNAVVELEKVIVSWAGNTELITEIRECLNVTWDDLHDAFRADESEVSPLDRRVCVMSNVVEMAGLANDFPKEMVTRVSSLGFKHPPGTPALATEKEFMST